MKIPLMRLQENKFGSKKSDASPLPNPPLPPFHPINSSIWALYAAHNLNVRGRVQTRGFMCAHSLPIYSDQKVAFSMMENALLVQGN